MGKKGHKILTSFYSLPSHHQLKWFVISKRKKLLFRFPQLGVSEQAYQHNAILIWENQQWTKKKTELRRGDWVCVCDKLGSIWNVTRWFRRFTRFFTAFHAGWNHSQFLALINCALAAARDLIYCFLLLLGVSMSFFAVIHS